MSFNSKTKKCVLVLDAVLFFHLAVVQSWAVENILTLADSRCPEAWGQVCGPVISSSEKPHFTQSSSVCGVISQRASRIKSLIRG